MDRVEFYHGATDFYTMEEAIEVVIKALEHEPCTDAISRQAVLAEMYKRKENGDAITAGFIKNLPSVTPTEKVEFCDDCVSRQTVINRIANTCFWLSADNWNELIKCINSISPVTPAEKVGHWEWVRCKDAGGGRMTLFKIIDKKTGKEPTELVIQNIAKRGNLIPCDIDGFYIDEYGQIILVDDCGNCTWLDMGRFKVEMQNEASPTGEEVTDNE